MAILQTGLANAAAGGGGYQIARSLRFNSADSAYLNRTPASAGNRQIWAWSGWVKRSKLGVAQRVLAGGSTGLLFQADDTLLFDFDGGSNYGYTSSVFRDIGACYHIVFTLDTTLATSTDRAKLWINNVRQTLTYSGSIPLNGSGGINNNVAQYICSNGGSSQFCDLMLADARLIDGQALDPTSFGEFDANTGVWNPKTYAGTYGTNGFWLKLDDNSNNTAATLGKDSSGNSNNWTPNNFSVTAGVGNDSLVDTPTNYGTDTGAGGEVRGNYATFNPLVAAGGTHSNGNLDYTAADNGLATPTTFFPSAGKWYCEIVWNSGSNPRIGITNTAGIGSNLGNTANSWGNLYDGRLYHNSSVTSYGVSISTGDVVMMALDLDTGKLWYGKNGTWMASGDPATGANPSQTFTANQAMSFAVSSGGGTPNWTGNFGQRPFAYTAPSGFKALTTTNLPTPAIGATSSTLAGKNMNAVLYTGNGSTLSVTGVGFQPDFVWAKVRSTTGIHGLFDAVRGVTKVLSSDSTAAENTLSGVTAFNSDGFSLGADWNLNAGTYVAWNWNAGGATVTNTAGSISSQVRANPTAGISIVTYTGLGNSGSGTVGHGLGADPKLIICKSRNNTPNTTPNWPVYHVNIGKDAGLTLNTTGATFSSANYWGTTTPNSTTFGVVTSGDNNNGNMVAYCFAEVAGFSKFGSYVGNGSTDGPFAYCGFRPKFILVKSTGSASWILYDTTRSTYNVNGIVLIPDLTLAELNSTDWYIDVLSNGFKLRTSYGQVNTSGTSFIFMAFAESPFNYARAR